MRRSRRHWPRRHEVSRAAVAEAENSPDHLVFCRFKDAGLGPFLQEKSNLLLRDSSRVEAATPRSRRTTSVERLKNQTIGTPTTESNQSAGDRQRDQLGSFIASLFGTSSPRTSET